jgi:polysaccharide biosynthesis transport protein
LHDVGLRTYLEILRRRKWIVLASIVVVPALAVLLALRQPPLYQTSADVLLRYQNLPATLSGLSDPNSVGYYVDPQRTTSTQVQLALLPSMARRVAQALPGVSASEALGSTSVQAVPDTDFLRFVVTNGNPELAPRLATEYARQYTLYRREIDTSSITQALHDLKQRITELQSSGAASSRLSLRQLQEKADQLQTLLTLTTADAQLVRPATGAGQIQPRPVHYGVFGFGLGIVLGIGLAFLLDLFDTRLRSTTAIESLLKLPLLARLPVPSPQLQRTRKLMMLTEPNSAPGEAFRILSTNLEFATLEQSAQAIMIVSAAEEEGKSTTIGNLAVALARAGRRVALVDLDLRRPTLARFFGIDQDRPGLTDVVLGHALLTDALTQVPVGNGDELAQLQNGQNGNGHIELGERPLLPPPLSDRLGDLTGRLEVLTSGLLPPNPGEFVGLHGVKTIISELRRRAEVILIDTAPMLQTGDAMMIGRFADASLVVVRSERARRPMVAELARVLGGCPAPAVGYVLCGASLEGYASYGYYEYGARTRGRKPARELVR